MGFFSNIIKGQLIDVIEWTDNTTDTMVHKYDMNGKEIMMGAQLTVRESQAAVFVNEGQLADVYTPGRYSLSTANMPMIRLRAFGIYAFRVTDPAAFLREVFGTASLFTVEGVEGQIKRTLVSGLSDAIAESKIPALDLAANYEELGAQALQAINPKLAPLGLQLSSFVIENISLPEEVEKTMDRRTSMGVMGDLGKYSQYQAAEAMREAANNPGGSAGMGMGMGAGVAMGQMFAQSLQAAQHTAPAQPTAGTQSAAAAFCSQCGQPLAPDAKFCSHCGAQQSAANQCAACGQPLQPGAKFCPNCGAKQ